MCDEVAKSAASVLLFRGGIFVARDRRFAILVARLARRFAHAMALPRDVLFIIIAPDATIDVGYVLQLIAMHLDRHRGLDNRFAIVMSPYGRDDVRQLKTLGRQRNIDIMSIPVSAAGLGPTAFQRVLSQDLFASDPFGLTTPVSEDTEFYGRRSEALTLARELQQGRVKSLFALRRAGKTSVLDRVQKIGAGQGSIVSTVVDLQDAALARLSAEDLIQVIIGSLAQAADSPLGYSSALPDFQHGSVDDSDLWRSLRLVGKPAVLLIDEVDEIVPFSFEPGPAARQFTTFWRSLRRLQQESTRQGCVFGLLVTGVSSHAFRAPIVGDDENSARRLVPDEYLPPFTRAASIAMVMALGSRCGLEFSESDAAVLAQLCGDLPYWMRQAGSFIHRSLPVARRPRPLPRGAADELVKQFIESSDGRTELSNDLAYLVRRMPVVGQALVHRFVSCTT